MQKKYKDLEQEILAFRQDNRREWDTRFAQLNELVARVA
jgi:hypothetical protein